MCGLLACQSSNYGSLGRKVAATEGWLYPNDAPATPAEFSVLTWNLEHFTDSYNNPYINNKREDAPWPKPLAERQALVAEALQKINADIVVLQEVEGGAYLNALADSLFPELGYKYHTEAESPNWYMNVVVLSKYPLGMLYSFKNLHTPATYTEEGVVKTEAQQRINTRMLTTEVLLGENYRLLLTGLHLKAGRSERDVAIRKGQAEALKMQLAKIAAAPANSHQIIAGDLNSFPGSEELQVLLNQGPVKFKDLLPPTQLTHPADTPVQRFDYVLASDALQKNQRGEATVPMPFAAEKMRKISDHLPVLARFTIER
jgi:endonuclease/exonuclease/phosphatase family metal-dependent hydrolase